MYNSVKERLKSFLKQENIKAVDFCEALGVSSGFISGMRESIQPDKLKSIAIKYPTLDIGWLMTGIGNMIKKDSFPINVSESYVPYEKFSNPLEEEVKRLREELKESYIEIGRLQGENRILREQANLGERKVNGKSA